MNVFKVFMSLCRYVLVSSERTLVLGGLEIKSLFIGDTELTDENCTSHFPQTVSKFRAEVHFYFIFKLSSRN